ncbi:MAG: hypothetical protein EBW87_02125 [Burkholderiaceae bacterium]|nr:hypothetical protein [Burkholderiaceae bacterium]
MEVIKLILLIYFSGVIVVVILRILDFLTDETQGEFTRGDLLDLLPISSTSWIGVSIAVLCFISQFLYFISEFFDSPNKVIFRKNRKK